MALVPIVTFRGVRPSQGLELELTRRAKKLETWFRPILSCHVVLEFSEKRHGGGNRYHVRIDVGVPGADIFVAHEASQRARARGLALARLPRAEEPDPGHKYAKVAIREAFDAARRRLQDFARRQRGAVKYHATGRTQRSDAALATEG